MLLHSLMDYTAWQCYYHCREYSDCQWYSHSYQNDHCLLFLTCPTIDEDNHDFTYTSYQADCYPEDGPTTWDPYPSSWKAEAVTEPNLN